MGSLSQRLFLFEHTTRNCLFNSYEKEQKWQKRKNMKRGKAHHWSVPDDQKVARRFTFQLGSQEDDQQVLVPRRLMFRLGSPEDAQKKSEGGKDHLRTFSKSGFENHLCEFLILSVLHTTRIK